MIFYTFLALGLVFSQFFLGRQLFNKVFLFFYRIIKHKNTAIRLLVISFLPGTIIHELSHFLAATFIGVRTGTINLLPKIKDDGRVIAGETQIAQCDPIRYSLIGVAPFFVGLGIIYSVCRFYLFESVNFTDNFFENIKLFGQVFLNFNLLKVFVLFLIFWVANSMFSSKKDLSMILAPLILLYIIGFILYFSGFKFSFSHQLLDNLNLFLKDLSFYLLFSLLISLLVFVFFNILNSILLGLAKKN